LRFETLELELELAYLLGPELRDYTGQKGAILACLKGNNTRRPPFFSCAASAGMAHGTWHFKL
jgi:hypothetical protein